MAHMKMLEKYTALLEATKDIAPPIHANEGLDKYQTGTGRAIRRDITNTRESPDMTPEEVEGFNAMTKDDTGAIAKEMRSELPIDQRAQMVKLRVSEIFYSLQGEGARAGHPSIFIRLSGCSAKMACYASGVRCDTEFESGSEMSLYDIFQFIKTMPDNAKKCEWIIWTGGEPMDQLTEEVAEITRSWGYAQALETSGLHPVPFRVDWLCVSPKVADHVVKKNFPNGVDELRYVRHIGQSIPEMTVNSRERYISPHTDGQRLNYPNLLHCINLVKNNPDWNLSIQMHKVWEIL